MPNMGQIIQAHNKKIINNNNSKPEERCNCIKKNECPLPGKCTAKNIIYRAKVKSPNETKEYIGLTSITFKTRFGLHKSSFNNKNNQHSTALMQCSHLAEVTHDHSRMFGLSERRDIGCKLRTIEGYSCVILYYRRWSLVSSPVSPGERGQWELFAGDNPRSSPVLPGPRG